ncbi:hypothetical protein GH733_002127 [Mirounga leonina]|nr:hypothetical protein GH733_002127 [Mirounga leonina]
MNEFMSDIQGYLAAKELAWKTAEEQKKFLVHNVKELEVLLMCNESHCAEIAHSVSSKNHKATVERAAQWAIRVANPNARTNNRVERPGSKAKCTCLAGCCPGQGSALALDYSAVEASDLTPLLQNSPTIV